MAEKSGNICFSSWIRWVGPKFSGAFRNSLELLGIPTSSTWKFPGVFRNSQLLFHLRIPVAFRNSLFLLHLGILWGLQEFPDSPPLGISLGSLGIFTSSSSTWEFPGQVKRSHPKISKKNTEIQARLLPKIPGGAWSCSFWKSKK